MSIVSTIGNAGSAVVAGIKKGIGFLDKADHVVLTVIKDQPELKIAMQTLFQKAEAITAEGVVVVGQKGLNFVADEEAVAEAEDFFRFFYSEVAPLLVKVYGEIKFDLSAAPAPTPAVAPATPAATPAPHAVAL